MQPTTLTGYRRAITQTIQWSNPTHRVLGLDTLARDIRGCLWQPGRRSRARQLAEMADRAAEREARRHAVDRDTALIDILDRSDAP